MTEVVLIYGGTKKPSRLNGIFNEARAYLEKRKFIVHPLYIHDIPSEDLIHANYKSPAIKEANAAIAAAHAIVVMTPVYKASFSGILKTYLDLIPEKGLQDKTILPLAIGGSLGHLLSIEYALKPVLSVLGANQILDSIFIHDQQVKRLDQDEFSIEEAASFRLHNGLSRLADEAIFRSSALII